VNHSRAVGRRKVLLAGAIAPAALLNARKTFAASPGAPIVLVHGAWHGGWCWKELLPLLRRAGREAFAPTLTGLGERSHLLNPAIDLATHISDVTATLEYEDLKGVVLVGHSYGGMVISGVAEKAPKHLSSWRRQRAPEDEGFDTMRSCRLATTQ
jgi:pimeloyl-ACP methyl ester carboxylesterase